MCTVTVIPIGNKIFIASNRDEKQKRKQALPPQKYIYNNAPLYFPKDADAGGTWIALKENSDAAVLLNGAFENHLHQPPYRKSRGLIFLDIISDDNPLKKFTEINLSNIEPFTIIILQGGSLYECRWDAEKHYQKKLDIHQPHIWSSATLYSNQVIQKRSQWFHQWLQQNNPPSQQQIFRFHHFGGDGDTHNDIRMNRNGQMLTVSITCMEISNTHASMIYEDLTDETIHRITATQSITVETI